MRKCEHTLAHAHPLAHSHAHPLTPVRTIHRETHTHINLSLSLSIYIYIYIYIILSKPIHSPNHNPKKGPRYNTKYPGGVKDCKAACQNEVARCDAINYSKYALHVVDVQTHAWPISCYSYLQMYTVKRARFVLYHCVTFVIFLNNTAGQDQGRQVPVPAMRW